MPTVRARYEFAGGVGGSPAAAGPQEASGSTSGHEAAGKPAEVEKMAADARGRGGGGGAQARGKLGRGGWAAAVALRAV